MLIQLANTGRQGSSLKSVTTIPFHTTKKFIFNNLTVEKKDRYIKQKGTDEISKKKQISQLRRRNLKPVVRILRRRTMKTQR